MVHNHTREIKSISVSERHCSSSGGGGRRRRTLLVKVRAREVRDQQRDAVLVMQSTLVALADQGSVHKGTVGAVREIPQHIDRISAIASSSSRGSYLWSTMNGA